MLKGGSDSVRCRSGGGGYGRVGSHSEKRTDVENTFIIPIDLEDNNN